MKEIPRELVEQWADLARIDLGTQNKIDPTWRFVERATTHELYRFAVLVAAWEREECAKLTCDYCAPAFAKRAAEYGGTP